MTKLVIPRTQRTIHYILVELEELAREELFRIKIIKKKKARMAEKEAQNVKIFEICPICNKPIEVDPQAKSMSDTKVKTKHEHKTEPAKVKVEITKPISKSTPPATPIPPIPSIQSPKVPSQPPVTSPVAPIQKTIPSEMPQKDSFKEIYKPPSTRTVTEGDFTQFLSTGEPDQENKLEYLKKLLVEIIGLGKYMVETGGNKIDMEDFLKVCEEAREKIDTFFEAEEEAAGEIDPNLKDRLQHLKLHLREVIDLTQNFRKETILSTSMEHFIETCEAVDEKLDVYVKNVESKPIGDDTKTRLLNLKEHIKDVLEMTEDYKQQGLLTPSVEDFIKTCEAVQIKIDEYTKDGEKNLDAEKLNHLKDHVGQLEKLTTDIKEEGLASSSLEKFMLSCKDFKGKLEEYKKKVKWPRPLYDGDMSKLVEQLEETIDLSMLAKEEGLIDESVDEFVKCCENIKKLFEPKENEEEDRPQTLSELKTNIGGIIQLINDLKSEGLITESVEDFLKTCEMTKDRIDVYERYPINVKKKVTKASEAPCTGSCTGTCTETCNCEHDKEKSAEGENMLCEKCEELLKEPIEPNIPYAPEPCDLCRGIIKIDEPLPYPCDSCTKPPEPTKCIHCLKNIDEEENPEIHTACAPKPEPPQPEESQPSPVDSSLGYFEKKIRKIVRVTRTMNDDGTIREETETIVIRKNRRDPTEQGLMDDDDDEGDDNDSNDEFGDDDDEEGMCVALCANMNPDLGFIRKTKSENIFKLPPIATPNLRNCLSLDILGDDRLSKCSFEIVASMQFSNSLNFCHSSFSH